MPAVRRQIKNIAFFGFSDFPKNSTNYREAFSVAQLLAQSGYTIVNGGGPGIMDAATQGAEAGGGETIAITFSPKDAPGFEGRYLANRVDKEIKTSNYIDRMFKLLEHADCFIIFKGGSGTISEFGTAWVLAKIYFGHHKPFILFGDFWIEVIDCIKRNMNLDREELSVFEIVRKKENVLPTIRRFEKRLQSVDHKSDNSSRSKFIFLLIQSI